MKRQVGVLLVVVAALTVIGCQPAADVQVQADVPPVWSEPLPAAPSQQPLSSGTVSTSQQPARDGQAGSVRLEPLPPIDPPASEPATRSYVVQKGEGLMAIARRELGDPARWREIKALNPDIPADNSLKLGQVIQLPAR